MQVLGQALLYLSSCGTHKLLAPILSPPATSTSAASSFDLFLMASSHSGSPQKGTRRSLPWFKFGLKSFHSSMETSLSSRSARALSYNSDWTESNVLLTSSTTEAILPVTLAFGVGSAFRFAITNSPFLMSKGPNSMRTGTPFISQKLNFQPGELSRSSTLARIPASVSFSYMSSAAAFVWSRSCCEVAALIPTTTITTCKLATLGGNTRPRSSP
mmetsp:Transcript_93708/g.264501  ORF Transcript_93708/g.264501 Transcript_93708/m.264501 type:complete len:215 (+) Transcript_93708:179-823(+)